MTCKSKAESPVKSISNIAKGSVNNEQSNDKIPLKRWSKEWFWEIRSSLFVILFTITLAVFTDVFVYAVVVPVVPFAFVDRMGVSENDLQSKVSAALAIYAVGQIVGAFVFGYISDKMKQRQTLMIGGLLIVIGSTLIMCLSKWLWLYYIGRFIQGVSAALVWTVGLAIVADSGNSDNIAFLMSFPGVSTALGMFLGPFLGGVVYEKVGYYPVFYVCFGILSADVALRFFMLEKSQLHVLRHKRAIELSQQDASTLSPELQTYMNRYIDFVDDYPVVQARQEELQKEFGTYITMFGRRYRVPVIFALLKNIRVANGVFLGIALAWAMTSIDSTVPLHLEKIFHFNSLQVGLVFLALAVPSVFEPIIGKVSDRFGSKYIISIGFLLLAPCMILLRLPTHKSKDQIVLFVALLALVGFFIMSVASPILGEMTMSVLEVEARHPGIFGKNKGFGQAYGLFNVGFSIGSVVGPFQAGATIDSVGWNMMTISLGIVCIITSIIAFMFAGGNIFKDTKKKNQTNDERV